MDAQDGFYGVATLDGRAKTLPSKSKKSAGAVSTIEEETSRVPPLMNPELPHLAAVLDKADVVIEILDAHDPLSYRSRALETRVSLKEGQRLLLVLNKIGAYSFLHFFADVAYIGGMIDGCPREPTAAWAAHLRTEHPTLLFRAASSFLPHDPTKGKGKEKEPSGDAWGPDAVCALLGRWAREKAGDGPLHVAVVGLANVRPSPLFPAHHWLNIQHCSQARAHSSIPSYAKPHSTFMLRPQPPTAQRPRPTPSKCHSSLTASQLCSSTPQA
jgi:nuclear GTP-binding protein